MVVLSVQFPQKGSANRIRNKDGKHLHEHLDACFLSKYLNVLDYIDFTYSQDQSIKRISTDFSSDNTDLSELHFCFSYTFTLQGGVSGQKYCKMPVVEQITGYWWLYSVIHGCIGAGTFLFCYICGAFCK